MRRFKRYFARAGVGRLTGGAVVLVLLCAACAHGRLPRLDADARRDAPRWPAPPQEPRVVWIGQIAAAADIVDSRGFWGWLKDFFFGAAGSMEFDRPLALALDSKGRLLVADPGQSALLILDPGSGKSKAIRALPEGALLSPVGVAVDGEDNFYVSDSGLGVVASFKAGGAHRYTIGAENFQRPTGLAVDRRLGRLYVADTVGNEIQIFALDGTKQGAFGRSGTGPGEFNRPVFLAVTPEGKIWVVDSLNGRLQYFDVDGKFIGQVGKWGDSPGSLARPKGIALDSAGHLYVADALFDNVQVFGDAGALLLVFGRRGLGKGEFWLPAGVVIDGEDQIFVADSSNHRVQIFQYLPEEEQ